ncbi:MAG TPA: sugar kinase [Acidobacteria bacterium]|nr:sugar kinase [Acidobacteriota bacterium]HIM15589.1 sugar kinase [Acidobacteriota bacterium]
MRPVLTVGSVAFDSVKTPSGEVSRVVGGAATFFSVAASFFTEVRLVAVVGDDFGETEMKVFGGRKIDLAGLQRVSGETFRWKGEYGDDLNSRETIYTHLNVFEEFRPHIPDTFRASPLVFLANIHPALQLEVLEQVQEPEFVALDTMNYWIKGALDELKTVLQRVDVVVINDEEARLLSGESSLVKASRVIRQMGPSRVVIKRGEHGVLMTDRDGCFATPGLPLEDVVDPTGAGDTFAGGFVGYLASSETFTEDVYRQAVICGSAMASLSVQDFGLFRLLSLADEDIRGRFDSFRHLTSFEQL